MKSHFSVLFPTVGLRLGDILRDYIGFSQCWTMRFQHSDLPDDVEKDGPCDIIETTQKLDKMTRSDKPVLTDRNGVVEEQEVNSNKVTLNGTSAKMAEVNGCSSRQPVENAVSDSEDNSGGAQDAEENEDLSETLSRCCISNGDSSTAKDDDEDDLSGKISNLKIQEKSDTQPGQKDEEQFIVIKSSDITTPQEIERRKREEADKMNERGPTGGIATNYLQHQPSYNQTAMKRYPASVNRQLYESVNNNFAYNQQPYNQQLMYNMMGQQRQTYDQFPYVQHNITKRTRDDFDEQPLKFTRPVETEFNNLSDPSKTQTPNLTFSNVVSPQRLCGGQVTVKSPEVEPLNGMMPFGSTTTSGEFDFMTLLGDNTFQESDQIGGLCGNTGRGQGKGPQTADLSNQDVYLDQTQLNLGQMDHVRRQTGHENRASFSDPDGCSEGYVSDVASPYSEQQDSPPAVEQSMYSPPPSNISACSVDSGMCMTTVPSPGSQVDNCSPRSTQTGYESNMDIYDPNSPFNPMSPASVTQNITTMGQNIPVMNKNIQSQNIQSQSVLPQQQGYQSNLDYAVNLPSNVAPVKPVYNSNGYGNIPDVSKADELITSEFIDENLANLKDVMETIAHDMLESKKKKPQPLPPSVSSQARPKQVILPQQRPLPSSQPNQMKPVASVLPSQAPNLLPAVPTTSAPVLLVKQPQKPVNTPNIITSCQSKGVPQASVTTSQILVIPAAPQPAPTFVIVTPQAPPVKKPTQYRPIQPKIPPSPAPGKGNTADSKNPVLNSSTKTVSSPKPVQQTCSTSPVVPVQQPKGPNVQSQVLKNNANQLNIARRLVANMTTDDLKFTDKDGDTFLHVGVCRADKYMVQALLERIIRENLQCMIDTQNSERQTPVYLAVSANQPEMVDLFNKYGADVNLLAERIAPNGQKEVKAAIHSAASNGKEYLQTLNALLKAPDLNLNMFNSDGCTALHCAILEHNQPRHENGSSHNSSVLTDSKPIIEALIRAGADPNAQDKKSGKTAFMYALESSDYTLVQTLLSLVDSTKVRQYFRTQAFDGSTCVKIMESRKSEFPHPLYEKLTGIMSSNRSALSHRRIDVA